MATQAITITLPRDVLTRIDRAAATAGMSRSSYIVQWLPESNDQTPQTIAETKAKNARERYRKPRGPGEGLVRRAAA